MQLRTKTAITHVDPTQKKMTGAVTKQSVVTMTIDRFAFTSNGGIEVPFIYEDGDGNIIDSPSYPGNVFRKTAEETKALSQLVTPALPAGIDNIVDRFWAEVKIQAINEMAQSFEIAVSDIEEVIE